MSFFFAVLAVLLSFSPLYSSTPFDDALGVWHFSDQQNDSDFPIQVHGSVQLGYPLSESESAESILRGGDGLAADFSQGGWIDAGLGKDGRFAVSGNELSCYLRLRFSEDQNFPTPIFSRHGGDSLLAYNIFAFPEYIGAQIGTTKNNRILSGLAKFDEMPDPAGARRQWHDVVLRVDGAKLEWFVDGRCYDEDFLLGEFRSNQLPLLFGAEQNAEGQIHDGFRGQIDTAAIWNRPLRADEILFLSGGSDRADQRERTDRGNGENLQYWIPPNNYSVGDCMPFYADGLFHFMYLLDKGHHSAKNGLGAHQWMQATSSDLIHWTHQPFAVAIDRQDEGSICTGSVFYHNGTYYAFYANRTFTLPNEEGGKISMAGQLALSVSKDGIHFEKKKEPLFLLPEGYAPTARDPVVFQDEKTNLFHIYVTCSYKGAGCWVDAVSENLLDWKLLDPIYTFMDGEPECPDWFEWGGKYYTIANHRNGYWRWSDSPTGPWDLPDVPNAVMPGITYVPKSAPFHDGRRIVCGWTGGYGYAGYAVFHELVRHPDGTLGEKFVPEMIPASEEPAVQENTIPNPNRSWKVPFGDCRLKLRIIFSAESRDLLRDIVLTYDSDKSLVISPRKRSISLGQFTIDRVDFSTGILDLDLIIKGALIDLDINRDRTITDSLSEVSNRIFTLQTDGEGWKLDSLSISKLKE